MTIKTVSILEVTPQSYKYFCCGKEKLDEFLKRYAKGNHKKGLGKTFVMQENGSIIGFYTISMGSIEFSSVPKNMNIGLPKYPIPIAKIGRLAVNEKSKGNGFGKFLLIDAFHRIYEASQGIAAYAILVDAKDRKAKEFYRHFGFAECNDNDYALFLPIKTVKQLFLLAECKTG